MRKTQAEIDAMSDAEIMASLRKSTNGSNYLRVGRITGARGVEKTVTISGHRLAAYFIYVTVQGEGREFEYWNQLDDGREFGAALAGYQKMVAKIPTIIGERVAVTKRGPVARFEPGKYGSDWM